MKSRWSLVNEEEHGSPVEMRFIDMFMTALGALVFLALLLVFLLPKVQSTATSETISNLNDRVRDLDNVINELNNRMQERDRTAQELRAENTQLNDRLREQERAMQQLQAENARLTSLVSTQRSGSLDSDVIKRWFSVLILSSGCAPFEPDLYVRWEGKLLNAETNEPVPDAAEFAASGAYVKTLIVGQTYSQIGRLPAGIAPPKGQEERFAEVEALGNRGLQATIFNGVSGASGSYSVYVRLMAPRQQSNRNCIVYPIYLGSRGVIQAEKITLNQQLPFAWLRRVTINGDGTTTFGKTPDGDAEFKRDLADFSQKQSQLLCERASLCDTRDAHYATLTPVGGQSKAGQPIRDCPFCPEMVVVPAGTFERGSGDEVENQPNEKPVKKVIIDKPFAVGIFAVTFAEWDACVADGECYAASDEGWGRGLRPAINVSWNDAKKYLAWLSKKSGKAYRLLTEAEREYITRAGSKTPFWWGSTISPKDANYDGTTKYNAGSQTGEYRKRTLPVKSFRPNNFGLYQVHGNILEWTDDCYEPTYEEVPTNGLAKTGECSQHVLRGGSWRARPGNLRSAKRTALDSNSRGDYFGFRVARDIE